MKFGIYKNNTFKEQLFPFDAIPWITIDYCNQMVDGILHLMSALGMWAGDAPAVRKPIISRDPDDVYYFNAGTGGIFESVVNVGDEVERGQLLARIIDCYEGEIIEELRAPADGIVFFMHGEPLTYSQTAVFKLILHEE